MPGVERPAHCSVIHSHAQFAIRFRSSCALTANAIVSVAKTYRLDSETTKQLFNAAKSDSRFNVDNLKKYAAVEQRKADIEIEYLEKVHEVKQRLYDIDTSRVLMEEELNMNLTKKMVHLKLKEHKILEKEKKDFNNFTVI